MGSGDDRAAVGDPVMGNLDGKDQDKKAVSGSIRSMKKRPVTSLAFIRSAAWPASSLPCAASAMRHHM